MEDLLAQEFYKPSSRICSTYNNGSECVLNLRRTFRELQSKPLPSTVKPRLDGPSNAWQVFKRLSLASSFADSATKGCMIFSNEERTPGSTGQRLFLVTHPQYLWANYKLRPPELRCSYEVIRENTPCKLYFDLEFHKIYNSGKDGNEMTKIFMKCIIALLLGVYNIKCNETNILWLESSTHEKFSSHLILLLPNTAFQNNVVAGSFVSLLLSNIMTRITEDIENTIWPTSEELKSLLICKADGKHVIFCDASVYTKNRNFRLYLSTKYGRRASLKLSEHNQYTPKDGSLWEDKREAIFYDSLITYFRNVVQPLKVLQEPFPECSSESTPKSSISSNPRTSITSKGFSESGPSPFPEVDNFILSQVKDSHATGFIRKWSYLKKEDIILYEIGNYRFCANIGRHHKSNNIMLIVDLKRKSFYQKCHDPECRSPNFKSSFKLLPSSVVSTYILPEDFFDECSFSQAQTQQTNIELDSNLADKTNSNDMDSMVVDDSFFEESFPFTQLSRLSDTTKNSHINTPQSDQIKQENPIEEDNFFYDNFFVDVYADNSVYTNAEANDDEDAYTGRVNAEENHLSDRERLGKKSSLDCVSADDELIMAETAAALECSFEEDMFSEETIF